MCGSNSDDTGNISCRDAGQEFPVRQPPCAYWQCVPCGGFWTGLCWYGLLKKLAGQKAWALFYRCCRHLCRGELIQCSFCVTGLLLFRICVLNANGTFGWSHIEKQICLYTIGGLMQKSVTAVCRNLCLRTNKNRSRQASVVQVSKKSGTRF